MTDPANRRLLVTGANGFVGRHLGPALRATLGEQFQIHATSRLPGNDPTMGEIATLDVTDAGAVSAAVKQLRPTHVIHLAGLASVGAASANPLAAWQVHVFGTLNVANAILEHAPACVMIAIGTGQVYGASARTGLPLNESTLLAPTNAYEASKAAGDLALGALGAQGLKCIRCRPFNHAGPGQTEAFVLPSFAMQIARIEAGLQPPVLRVGNLDAERDFLDVRDVVNAYTLAVVRSQDVPSGTIMNFASGTAFRIGDLLAQLLTLSTTAIAIEQDPTRMRPSDTPRYVGDAVLARRLLGWEPKYTFDETLVAVLNDARSRLRAA